MTESGKLADEIENGCALRLFVNQHSSMTRHLTDEETKLIVSSLRVVGREAALGEQRSVAFKLLQRHPECLRDDVPLQDFIEDIALALSHPAPVTGNELSEEDKKDLHTLRDLRSWLKDGNFFGALALAPLDRAIDRLTGAKT